MSAKFQEVISAFALSAVAATWFVGAKGAFNDSALADEPRHQVTLSQTSAQIESASKTIAQPKQREVNLSDWTCSWGKGEKNRIPFMDEVLSKSSIGLFSLRTIANTGLGICRASEDIYQDTWGTDTGALFDSVGIAFFSMTNPSQFLLTHEIAHANKYIATKHLSKRLLEEKKYSSFVVSKLADEAGNIALEIVSAYNDKLKGSSDRYRMFMGLSPEGPHGAMAQIFDQLIKEKPSLGAIAAIPTLQFPAEGMDQLLCRYLKHAGQEVYIQTELSTTKDSYDDVNTTSQPSHFEAPRLTPSDACIMAMGTMYKSGTEFPLTATVLEELGANIGAFMEKRLPAAKTEEDLDKMTTDFVSTLTPANKFTFTPPAPRTAKSPFYISFIGP